MSKRNKHNPKNDHLSKFHDPTREFNNADSHLDDLFAQIHHKDQKNSETKVVKKEQEQPSRHEIGG